MTESRKSCSYTMGMPSMGTEEVETDARRGVKDLQCIGVGLPMQGGMEDAQERHTPQWVPAMGKMTPERPSGATHHAPCTGSRLRRPDAIIRGDRRPDAIIIEGIAGQMPSLEGIACRGEGQNCSYPE